jgi:hypothetical protein
MGHGAARELEGAGGPLPELDPALAAVLTDVLNKLDARDPVYKAAREEERLGLLIKRWNGICRDLDDHLRVIGKVLINTHQLSLDIGSDGGGMSQKPFLEDLRQKFTKLQFRLEGDGMIGVVAGDLKVGRGSPDEVDFDWTMRMVVEWVVQSAARL